MQHGVQGMFFEPHDFEDAGRVTKHVLENREKMGRASFEHGRKFTWQRSIDNLQFFYQEVIPGANWMEDGRQLPQVTEGDAEWEIIGRPERQYSPSNCKARD